MTHMPDLIQDERQVRGYVVPLPALELVNEIVTPVGSLEFHAIAEKRPESLRDLDRWEEVV